MCEDDEGFLYPRVEMSSCSRCGLCEEVCPIVNPLPAGGAPTAFAVKHRDGEIRATSSSGGVFTALAEQTIRKGGVVFGATWTSDWSLAQAATETLDGLAAFRGSKYLQSRMGDSYLEARNALARGRHVLFSGTPCQIAGFRRFLGREYPRLLTVDVVCHGVPSPGVFRDYLRQLVEDKCPRGAEVTKIAFRNKDSPFGWRNAGFVLGWSCNGVADMHRELSYASAYGQGFLANLFLRPACHDCAAKGLHSGSDITLGDFWTVRRYCPEMEDNIGVSLVFVNTDAGKSALASSDDKLETRKIRHDNLRTFCPMLTDSVKAHAKRSAFFAAWRRGQEPLASTVRRLARPNCCKRLRKWVSNIVRRMIWFVCRR